MPTPTAPLPTPTSPRKRVIAQAIEVSAGNTLPPLGGSVEGDAMRGLPPSFDATPPILEIVESDSVERVPTAGSTDSTPARPFVAPSETSAVQASVPNEDQRHENR
jgi:hypothetical protein